MARDGNGRAAVFSTDLSGIGGTLEPIYGMNIAATQRRRFELPLQLRNTSRCDR